MRIFITAASRKNEKHKNGEKTSQQHECEPRAGDARPVPIRDYLLRQGQFLLFDLLKRLKRILVCYFKAF